MEHERYYALMMDALDGELSADNWVLLELHLTDCTACRREWHALVAIDRLLQQAPMLSPAAGFTQRTLARLPDHRYRIWLMGMMYTLLLLSGLVPLLAGAWLVQRAAAVISLPDLFWGLGQMLVVTGQVLLTVLNALGLGLGQLLSEQPAIIGTVLIMTGIVFLWGGIYQQLLRQPVMGD
jgi:predicted anti-sigma-YlaC factor YlaD